jgi:hypothetical protein
LYSHKNGEYAMQKKSLFGAVSAIVMLVGGADLAHADTNLWVSDTNGTIGLVDITTGAVTQVHNTGKTLTDIGFIGSQLYGVTVSNLFKINKATGASTLIGSNFSDQGMNALVGKGAGLLGASSASTNIYSISPTTAALTIIPPPSRLPSAGDLAFSSGMLFESAEGFDFLGELVNVSTETEVGRFHTTTIPSFTDVYGLADDGTTMFAVAGTEIYTVNLSNARLTPVLNYAGHGLVDGHGIAFVGENGPMVPEPSTWAMMMLGFFGYRASRNNAASA